MMKQINSKLAGIVGVGCVPLCAAAANSLVERAEVPYLKGNYSLAIEANPAGDEKAWFINDHCIIEDDDGLLHFIGINNPYPPPGKDLYRYHPFLGHATCNTAPMNQQEWKREKHALDDSEGGEFLGAPFVAKYDGKYVMLFESWLEGKRHLELAWSDDLYTWERTFKPVMHNLGLGDTKRDPCIIRENGEYLIYVCNPHPDGSKVACVRTKDFKAFSEPKNVISIPDGIPWGGIESPFVLKRKGLYYAFLCYAHRHYSETIVVVSDDPESFEMKNAVTTLFTHAPEIFSYKGRTYITNCGPEDRHARNTHGLEMVELGWLSRSSSSGTVQLDKA